MSDYLVTATPPTSNGDLHIGHLSGPYLAADVFTRYQRYRGNNVVYLCSSDDHQTYVMTTAKRLNQPPAQVVTNYNQLIQSTLKAAEIEVDVFTASFQNIRHIKVVQELFRDMYDHGLLKERVAGIFYCEHCSQYLFESFVSGLCPYCGEPSCGNLCEDCGRVNDPVNLRNATCTVCHNRPILAEYKGIFFPLEVYRSQLVEFYSTRTAWRPHLQALCSSLTSQPMPDYPVSYPTSWGIPVPIDGFAGQAINPWFEMYPGHTASLAAFRETSGFVQPVASNVRPVVVQFLGYDNSFFNAVLHPALSFATDKEYFLVDQIVTNEFYLLDNEKFSTSKNHAIWGSDFLKSHDADSMRYYLCRTNPEQRQTSFSQSQFAALIDEELVRVWSPTISRLLDCLRQDFGGVVPDETDVDLKALGLFSWAKSALERFYDKDNFSLYHASHTLKMYVEGCADYLERMVEPSRRHDRQFFRKRVMSLAWLVKGLAYFAAPIMPAFSERLWNTFGIMEASEMRQWSAVDGMFSGDEAIKGDQTLFQPTT